jgi:hypothetical protein
VKLSEINHQFGDSQLDFEEFGLERTALYGGDSSDHRYRILVAVSLDSDELVESIQFADLVSSGYILSIEVLELVPYISWHKESVAESESSIAE